MKKIRLFQSLFFVPFLVPAFALAWECDVTVSGPKTIKLNQQITLSAHGTPAGGSYSWSRTPNLTPNGSTATLTGFKPTYSEYIRVIGYYTSPKGKKCKDTKWIWACLCNIDSISGPGEAKVGQEVSLSTQAEPAGGTFTWTINSGTGVLTPNGSSAVFIGDKGGPVEIKVSYVPPNGGEPCDKYHTIQVNEDCEVTLTGGEYQRPVCRAIDFSAEGKPSGGTCSWTAGNGISGTGCSAVYNAKIAGNDTVTVTYTTPGGTTCDDSKNVFSYSLDGMVSNKNCFESGSALQHSDFDFFISPSGFTFQPTISPATVTTNQSQARILVTASPVCDSGFTNEASTVIDVVNKDIKITSEIEVEIPNQLTTPLEFFGLADKLEFNADATLDKTVECCDDGPDDKITGMISVKAEAELIGFPIAYSIPVPKKMEKYFSFSLVEADLKAESSLEIKGEHQACQNNESWGGGGKMAVEFGLGSNAKVDARYVLLQGEVKGETDIKQTMTIDSSLITSDGSWGGVVVKGLVKITIQSNDVEIKAFDFTHQVLQGDATPTVTIDLPSLH